ncbi:VPS4-associated protein 1 [Parasitella parasitica]|nr:VPS4-associated protein 1 [Parasitella parasitica]
MAAESKQSQRLQNLYVARLVTQERPCFVCSKFTSAVLTSADNSNADWFYICRSHLGDFNFCSKLGGSPKPVQSKAKKEQLASRPPESDSVVDLVSSIGSAWKSWRGSNSGHKTQDDEGKKREHDQDEESKQDEPEENKQPSSPTLNGSTSTSTNNTPSSPSSSSMLPTSSQQPVRFVIQRDYFYLRQREHRKKIEQKEASEKLKTLNFPEVPKTLPTIPKQ